MFIPNDLYEQILRVMPIVCVDLVIINPQQQILLVKRQNPPLQYQWWVPGGRVLHGELRKDAAKRKLWEECSLETDKFLEIGTYDLILETPFGYDSHGVSTFYKIYVDNPQVKLDIQSSDFAWKTKEGWEKILTDPFLLEILNKL
jgi:8-oxo-dGTP diphosphatase